jgi:hypothetical protein
MTLRNIGEPSRVKTGRALQAKCVRNSADSDYSASTPARSGAKPVSDPGFFGDISEFSLYGGKYSVYSAALHLLAGLAG